MNGSRIIQLGLTPTSSDGRKGTEAEIETKHSVEAAMGASGNSEGCPTAVDIIGSSRPKRSDAFGDVLMEDSTFEDFASSADRALR